MTLDLGTWRLVLLARIVECDACDGTGWVERHGRRGGVHERWKREHGNVRTRHRLKRCQACGKHNQVLEQIGGPRGFLRDIREMKVAA